VILHPCFLNSSLDENAAYPLTALVGVHGLAGAVAENADPSIEETSLTGLYVDPPDEEDIDIDLVIVSVSRCNGEGVCFVGVTGGCVFVCAAGDRGNGMSAAWYWSERDVVEMLSKEKEWSDMSDEKRKSLSIALGAAWSWDRPSIARALSVGVRDELRSMEVVGGVDWCVREVVRPDSASSGEVYGGNSSSVRDSEYVGMVGYVNALLTEVWRESVDMTFLRIDVVRDTGGDV